MHADKALSSLQLSIQIFEEYARDGDIKYWNGIDEDVYLEILKQMKHMFAELQRYEPDTRR